MRGLSWRRVGWTGTVAAAVAVLLCVPGMSLAQFPRFLVACLVFAMALMLALTAAGNWPPGRLPTVATHAIAVAAACLLGTLFLSALQGRMLWRELASSAGREDIIATLAIGLVIGAAMAFVMVLRERQSGDHARHDARERLLQKQVLESRLKLLQAQVEPHFLFNTLAHVQRLVTTDPPAALALLEHLTLYLRAALPDMRENQSTLGCEIDMAQAYLNIMQTRMGDRLVFRVDLPASLRNAAFPPMMLLSLVENAVEHGVGDSAHGLISITASIKSGALALQVADNGHGFDPHAAPGIGLANIRERLQALYGSAAKLMLEERPGGSPSGVTATLVVPYTHAAP